jgi:hypothetical protein
MHTAWGTHVPLLSPKQVLAVVLLRAALDPERGRLTGCQLVHRVQLFGDGSGALQLLLEPALWV